MIDANENALSAINSVLSSDDYGSSFVDAWVDFTARNLFNGDTAYRYYIDQDIINPINTNLLLFQLTNSQAGFTNSTITDCFESAAIHQLKISISIPLISNAVFVA